MREPSSARGSRCRYGGIGEEVIVLAPHYEDFVSSRPIQKRIIRTGQPAHTSVEEQAIWPRWDHDVGAEKKEVARLHCRMWGTACHLCRDAHSV
ncbi:Hypothetical protein NTJ_14597 [Nesidiocoris tenuis]|uniref:Uncharacterized protein n=1 Tax=Nesidiocoris tenuis TaxID=355587 RepID=A0ABN7BBS2_9HEMI|nr:Hypothetical protein NTJ_14597 [Nesidiocoris tenuis]